MKSIKDELIDKTYEAVFGNGKCGLLERVGKLEVLLKTFGLLIVGLQTTILIKLFWVGVK